jgi:polysaccharide biosynthesis/export protein
VRDGKSMRKCIDVAALFMSSETGEGDPIIKPGDVVYVHRAPQVYIYGEVQRPGNFRLERDMTVMQALAMGGGLTAKGTQRHIRVHRRSSDGSIHEIEPQLDDPVQPDDVVYVRESIF